jgi:1-acyl-sn-glycerol-3-phosphate acyltransferase
MTLAYQLFTGSIKGITQLLCEIDGAELGRVPAQGPLILAANHVNFIEVPILYTQLLPRPVTGYVKSENQGQLIGRLLFDLWGGIPLRRGEADVEAVRKGLEALEQGKILAIAPEGTRSGDGSLQRAHPGIVLLALKSGAPILPLAYHGAENYRQNLARLRRSPFRITVGRPFYLHANGTRVTREVRQHMADEIMYQIAALLPPAYRGVYSDGSASPPLYVRFRDQSATE